MKNSDLIDPRQKFKFLDDKTANEPHVFEVLNEILSYQMSSLPSGEKPLATMDTLKKSSRIKIPFTSTRDRTIEYLIDILLKRFSHFVRPIISFEFTIDQSSKQIDIYETTEYSILLDTKDYEKIIALRDAKSAESLLDLLKKYRFFNLSKLMKKADEKEELSRVIKNLLDTKIFTFKNYSIDNDKIEWAEDFCFYVDNYEPVKESLNLNTLKEIISSYSESVKKSLNKFGIINAEFSDYRDTKLAYIFSILTDDLSTTLADKDLVDVKNLQSLVSCLNRVDKVLDPVLIVNEDIVKFIREHKIISETQILGTLTEINNELLKKWANPENLKTNKIVVFPSNDGETYYIDGLTFFQMISELNQLIVFQPEQLRELSHTERRRINSQMDILYGASIILFKSADKIGNYIKINPEKIQIFKKIIEDYDKFKRKLLSKETPREMPSPKKKDGMLKRFFTGIFNFIFSLFRFYAKGDSNEYEAIDNERIGQRRQLSQETAKVYKKTMNMNMPVIPLSEFIELIPENDYLVNRIIDDLRENNLKIVIPIYNARKNLYPKRSQKLLVPDVEYLLVSPETAKLPDAVRRFTDSLVGQKIKDEIIPATAIIAIEKYLLTLYRQRKSIKQ